MDAENQGDSTTARPAAAAQDEGRHPFHVAREWSRPEDRGVHQQQHEAE